VSIYPDTLKTILIYIEALDEADKKIAELKLSSPPYLLEMPITDGDGINWGRLVDEIGGSWSWSPSSQLVDEPKGPGQ
jgi:hypothetical protein